MVLNFIGTRRITDCGVAVVVVAVVIGVCIRVSISSRSSVDYGSQDYGFVRIADYVQIGDEYGLQDYGSF